ncbi:Golgi membrane protein 1 isoform X1 [Triplophysa rosa]|uniref:Golgi membrane protein 1 isoform X1 n=1 Tax=Triplophysa rosa TaxID=992332 RepID=UPI0025460BA6|nr:Golgi membrane protein 1 isoform X1 [Triplophysa rosa]
MMGALGNGRRGGRSPSLLVAALIACILLIGFNYWVSNSRNIELQSKILELEDRMRLLAADRDREQQSKMKVEDEMRMQNERMGLIEDTHRRQQDTTLNNWRQEKEILKLNISSSAKTVQEMKNHMKSLLEDLSKRQNELKSCQSNADTFMTQIATMEEKCNEKTEESKLEEHNAEKEPAPVAPQDVAGSAQTLAAKAKSEIPATNHSDKNVAKPSNSKPEVESRAKDEVQVQNNEKLDAVIIGKSPIPTYKPTNKNETLERPDSKKVPEAVMDIKGESLKTDTLLYEAGILEPKDDDIRMGDGNEEKDRIGEGREDDDVIMYDNEGEIEKQLSKIKDENQDAGQDLEDEMANYNGEDDNQPESEDEKQAELTGM